jgi:hypothetical protein
MTYASMVLRALESLPPKDAAWFLDRGGKHGEGEEGIRAWKERVGDVMGDFIHEGIRELSAEQIEKALRLSAKGSHDS